MSDDSAGQAIGQELATLVYRDSAVVSEGDDAPGPAVRASKPHRDPTHRDPTHRSQCQQATNTMSSAAVTPLTGWGGAQSSPLRQSPDLALPAAESPFREASSSEELGQASTGSEITVNTESSVAAVSRLRIENVRSLRGEREEPIIVDSSDEGEEDGSGPEEVGESWSSGGLQSVVIGVPLPATAHGTAGAAGRSLRQLSLEGFYRCAGSDGLCPFHSLFPEALEQHLRDAHPADDTYTCVHCGSREVGVGGLMEHLAQHLSPHSHSLYCSDLACRFVSTSPYDVISHMTTHHPQLSPHVCWHCNARSDSLQQFDLHVKHSLLSVAKCPHCPARHVDMAAILDHVSLSHPNQGRRVDRHQVLLCQERQVHGWCDHRFSPTSDGSVIAPSEELLAQAVPAQHVTVGLADPSLLTQHVTVDLADTGHPTELRNTDRKQVGHVAPWTQDSRPSEGQEAVLVKSEAPDTLTSTTGPAPEPESASTLPSWTPATVSVGEPEDSTTPDTLTLATVSVGEFENVSSLGAWTPTTFSEGEPEMSSDAQQPQAVEESNVQRERGGVKHEVMTTSLRAAQPSGRPDAASDTLQTQAEAETHGRRQNGFVANRQATGTCQEATGFTSRPADSRQQEEAQPHRQGGGLEASHTNITLPGPAHSAHVSQMAAETAGDGQWLASVSPDHGVSTVVGDDKPHISGDRCDQGSNAQGTSSHYDSRRVDCPQNFLHIPDHESSARFAADTNQLALPGRETKSSFVGNNTHQGQKIVEDNGNLGGRSERSAPGVFPEILGVVDETVGVVDETVGVVDETLTGETATAGSVEQHLTPAGPPRREDSFDADESIAWVWQTFSRQRSGSGLQALDIACRHCPLISLTENDHIKHVHTMHPRQFQGFACPRCPFVSPLPHPAHTCHHLRSTPARTSTSQAESPEGPACDREQACRAQGWPRDTAGQSSPRASSTAGRRWKEPLRNCQLCPHSGRSLHWMRVHVYTKHKRQMKCPVCSRSLKNDSHMRSHLSEKHNDKNHVLYVQHYSLRWMTTVRPDNPPPGVQS